MTTELTRQTQVWFQFKWWEFFNFWASQTQSIKTDDDLWDVTRLAQWTSWAWTINTLRVKNIDVIWETTQRKIEWKEIKQLESPKDSINFIESASKESDPELQEKWANLLANGLTGVTKIWRYIAILKELSSDEVKVLDILDKHYIFTLEYNKVKINELEMKIKLLENEVWAIYESSKPIIDSYYQLQQAWLHEEANKLRTIEQNQQAISNFETKRGELSSSTIELEWLNNPFFLIKEISEFISIQNIWEIIDNLKRLELLQNSPANWIQIWSEVLVTSNKFRPQFTDLGKSFVLACKYTK